ncbi:hypothetical protein EXIGLDRAFT_315929 [Exidia glandulosa HHB12029]|uniref:Uncharacterized protein n=1 Tax=Exidia glandulosa HHB12029 TaxID=1314781 RepID=A0A165CX77_EXIGL|nr:hypothetical protein EXIGLDRAFT_315929 [Exidia glandulosa HHB12029]
MNRVSFYLGLLFCIDMALAAQIRVASAKTTVMRYRYPSWPTRFSTQKKARTCCP